MWEAVLTVWGVWSIRFAAADELGLDDEEIAGLDDEEIDRRWRHWRRQAERREAVIDSFRGGT